jgi:hypothetical protein
MPAASGLRPGFRPDFGVKESGPDLLADGDADGRTLRILHWRTDTVAVPARLKRSRNQPWSPFHTRMVVALGVAWILDGQEITVASAVADTLTRPETLALSSAAVGLIASVYLAGEVVGALFFGRLSDKLGRRNLFMVTLAVPRW